MKEISNHKKITIEMKLNLKYFMSEGNTCITQPNLGVLSFAKYSNRTNLISISKTFK